MRFAFVVILFIANLSVQAQSLVVMTYNIRFDNPEDSVNAWPNRKQKVIDLLKKYNPDLLGVQEALYHQLKDMTDNLPDYQFVGVGRDDGKRKGEYSAILYKKSKLKLTEQNTFWLSEHPDVPGSKNWDAAITRVATWAKFTDIQTKRRFVMVNTHFDHVGVEARRHSAEILKSHARELGFDIPVIVTGDFNCTRDEDPYKIMTNGELLELIDPCPNPEGTFCTFRVDSVPCKAIDYIFISNDWRADRYKIIHDNDGTYYPSDHLPVSVTLSLAE